MKNIESLPNEYKGFTKEYLLKILSEIGTEQGTTAPEDHIEIMGKMLREYKVGVHAQDRDGEDK